MARKKAVTEEEVAEDVFRPQYGEILRTVERQFKLTAASSDIEARRGSYLSTGLLATDLILGGGFVSGAWCTVFGGEQSCKSTFCMHTIIAAVEQDVPLIINFDYEASGDPEYYGNTIASITSGRISADDIFGIVDHSTGEVIKAPKVHTYNESVGEQFFNSMSSLLRNMPDKLYIDGQWYFVYENTNVNRKIVGTMYNKKLFSEFNKFCVPAPNGKPQALLLVDSYPYMFPDKLDEDDKNAGMAAVARMMSENIPKLAPKLKKKGVVVLGVNQLRLRPAVMYGSPEYEPGGEAIKFTSSVRVRQASRAIPHGTGQIEEEDSVTYDGGKDTYRYIQQKAAKNKTGGIPGAEVFQRVWVADAEGKARGICPVWDCFQYLKMTGQATGTMKKLKIDLPNCQLEKITWWDFKGLILMTGKDLRAHCESLGLTRNPKVRDTCRKQLDNGTGYTKYVECVRGIAGGKDEGDADE